MQRFFDLTYRTKLLMTYLIIVLLIVSLITTLVIMGASQHLQQSSTGSLYLLTEQALINCVSGVETAERYLYSMSVSSGAAKQMGHMRISRSDYWPEQQELWYNLSKMIDSHAMYDHVAVRLEGGLFVHSYTYDLDVVKQSQSILSLPAYSDKQYGKAEWARTEQDEVYLIRDVYDTQPLRYVGKMCARIRTEDLVTMSDYNDAQGGAVFFFNEHGEMIISVGEKCRELEQAAKTYFADPTEDVVAGGLAYAACVMTRGGWSAVGLMPMSAMERLQRSVMESGLVAAALGILLGLVSAIALSRQLSGRISILVDSMHRVEAGDLNVTVPVQGKDEIDVLAGQFNRMTANTKKLLEKVVQEENSKRQAEFMNLEYEYRFLQWQVNPHFIYNALETINALAKIDGNDELSDMILLLSDYFRKNAEAIRKKFVTVSQEFRSLAQYAEIYRVIYGDSLHVEFDIAPQVESALLPTMIIQPLLENALVHGTGARAGTEIRAFAKKDGEFLLVMISDNGSGMTEETISRILGARDQKEKADNSRTSLGVRNVLDRMHLLYGEAGSMSIESELGKGTCVSVRLPLRYEEHQDFMTEKR